MMNRLYKCLFCDLEYRKITPRFLDIIIGDSDTWVSCPECGSLLKVVLEE